MSDSRWILVDDNDPGIQYHTGSWFLDQNSQNGLGNNGLPYKTTLHGTKSNGSFSYTFKGSKVWITGTVQYPANALGPTWVCTVDGVGIPSIPSNVPDNKLGLCLADNLLDAQHNITVQAIVSSQDIFWFDYVQYLPSSDVSLDNVSLAILPSDPQIHFGAGWQPKAPGAYTNQTGSNFTFDFSGTSLTWLGFYDNSLPTGPSTATYSIDGGSPITFNLYGISPNTGSQYNTIFFETEQLAPGNHQLQVVHGGNSSTTPLTFANFQVQNSTAGTPNSSSSAPSGLPSKSSGTSPPGNPSKSPSNLAAIVGGVIGGLALLSLIFALLLHRRKKNKRGYSITQPFDPAPVVPFREHSVSGPASNSYYVPAATLSPASNNRYLPSGTVTITPYQAEPQWSSTNTKPTPFDTQTPSPPVIQPRAKFVTPNSIVPTNQSLPTAPTQPDGYVRVARDEDSGMRFRDGDTELLPPGYTPA